MVIAAIIIGIVLVFLFSISSHISNKRKATFDVGVSMGIVISFFFVIEAILVGNIIKVPTPTAMYVYQGKTTLEHTVRDSVKIDSIVVFKYRETK